VGGWERGGLVSCWLLYTYAVCGNERGRLSRVACLVCVHGLHETREEVPHTLTHTHTRHASPSFLPFFLPSFLHSFLLPPPSCVCPCTNAPPTNHNTTSLQAYNAIWLDQDKCIKCGRCVAVCEKVQGIGASLPACLPACLRAF
jgi:hypothetical protein